MARETHYTCDRCGKTDNDLGRIGLKTVAVGIKEIAFAYYDTNSNDLFDANRREAEWCAECLVKVGIYPKSAIPNTVQIDPPPTLENLIREIIQEEIQNPRDV